MDFAFNTGPFDHGGAATASAPGPYFYLGKTTEVTIGGESSILVVVSITDIAPEIAQIETTEHDETTWRTFATALKEVGGIKFTVQHDKDDLIQIRLHDLKDSGKIEQFRIWLPGSPTTWISFEGFVSNVRYDVPKDGIVQGTFTVRPTSEFRRY